MCKPKDSAMTSLKGQKGKTFQLKILYPAKSLSKMKENYSFRVILSASQKLRECIVIRRALPEILRKFFRQKECDARQ